MRVILCVGGSEVDLHDLSSLSCCSVSHVVTVTSTAYMVSHSRIHTSSTTTNAGQSYLHYSRAGIHVLTQGKISKYTYVSSASQSLLLLENLYFLLLCAGMTFRQSQHRHYSSLSAQHSHKPLTVTPPALH